MSFPLFKPIIILISTSLGCNYTLYLHSTFIYLRYICRVIASQAQDTGSYVCTAVNEMGRAQSQGYLSVKGRGYLYNKMTQKY